MVEAAALDDASRIIQQLCTLRDICAQIATFLVREAFVRRFANGKSLESYASLPATASSSGGVGRKQGIGKASLATA